MSEVARAELPAAEVEEKPEHHFPKYNLNIQPPYYGVLLAMARKE
jgi:hypothetical protein